MMYKELKKEILNWLLEHENELLRVSACVQAFKPYIYNTDGNYLIGGKNVSEFISEADELLYGDKY